jgi:hypothetical protein
MEAPGPDAVAPSRMQEEKFKDSSLLACPAVGSFTFTTPYYVLFDADYGYGLRPENTDGAGRPPQPAMSHVYCVHTSSDTE